MKGEINLTLEGATYEQTERCRQIIHTLFTQGVFNVRRGRVILHFSDEGTLESIDMEVNKYRRRNLKQLPVASLYESAKVKATKVLETVEQ